MAGLLDQVSWTAKPFATTLKVTGVVDGRTLCRHVAILTVGRMQPMTIPQVDLPWMAIPDQLGIPMEWSAHVYVRQDSEVREHLRRIMSRITSQTKHYQVEHEQEPPTALREQHDLALQVEAELADTQDLSASRARGWWRLAVSGTNETECLENVERVVTAYARRVQVEHTYGQHDLAREFLPGEPVRIRAHRRDLPVRTVAAGGAAITSTAGDRRGWTIARAVLDGRTPVMYDLWANMERFGRRRLLPDRRRPRRREVQAPPGPARTRAPGTALPQDPRRWRLARTRAPGPPHDPHRAGRGAPARSRRAQRRRARSTTAGPGGADPALHRR